MTRPFPEERFVKKLLKPAAFLLAVLALASCANDAPLFRVFEKGKFGYADAAGKTVISPAFQQCGEFSEGLAVVLQDGKAGFIDRSGKTVITPAYVNAGKFSEGLAFVAKDGKIGFIDKSGKVVIPFDWEYATDF